METFDIKFLSKEPAKAAAIAAAPSFRIYYGDNSGAIPFTWEKTPGTPKHDYFSDSNPPPLTPPPSYSYSAEKNSSKISSGRSSWRSYSSSNMLQSLFKSKSSKHILRNQPDRGSQRSLSTLSSSSFSSWTSSSTSGHRRRSTRRGLSWGSSSFDNVGGDEQHDHPRMQSDNGRLSRSVKYCFSRFCFPASIRSE